MGEGQICFRFRLEKAITAAGVLFAARTILSTPFPFSAPGSSYPAFPASSSPAPPPSPPSPPFPTRTSISPTSTLHLSSPHFVYVILHEERQVVRLHRISFAHSSTPSSEHHSLIHTFQRFSATDTPCKTTNGSTLTAYLLPNHLCLSPTALPRTMRAFSIMHRLITITEVAPARDTT